MKLRVRHNSVRFRLGQSEVEALNRSGECREAILFPGGAKLEYVLLASGSGNGQIRASFSDGVVAVTVPRDQVVSWHGSDQVGITADIDLEQGRKLSILIEKDFRCIDERPDEDQSDTFANPLGALSCS